MSEFRVNVRLDGVPRGTRGTVVTVNAGICEQISQSQGKVCFTAGITHGRTPEGFPISGWSVDLYLSGTLPINNAELQLGGGYQRFVIKDPNPTENPTTKAKPYQADNTSLQ